MAQGRTSHQLRKFRFARPQKIAAVLLLVLLAECLWVSARQQLSETDYRYARCGREMWERPSPLAGYFTTCGNIHDGTLAYRVAGLPLTVERILRGQARSSSMWDMRFEAREVKLLLRLPFMLAGLALGACLWWVTRRLFGNAGGYISLALYCCMPEVVRASTTPNNEILAAFGVFSTIYLAIGVAHALQGPPRKWRPRIVLLTLALGFTAAAHLAAFAVALAFTVVFMAWVAEGRRAYIPTLLIVWVVGAFLLLFASYAFHPDAFSYVFRSAAGRMWLSMDGARWFFSNPANAAFTMAVLAALALYVGSRRSRYFGNTAPLLVAVPLMVLVTTGVESKPWLWGLPFLIAFVGGVFADALETRGRKAFYWATAVVLAAQAGLCGAWLWGLARAGALRVP
ncbi:MAG TPA: glycosyltransferase family 39 protein [Acidobacteriaceae bacterium]|nr:glycosyltransferase family 39 protein [Acidobacteriaceae bacterium]